MDIDESAQHMYDLCVHANRLLAEIVERKGELEEVLGQLSDLWQRAEAQRKVYLGRN